MPAVTFRSTKTYGHDVGLSCAFRQWRADSHCNKLHGYALSVRVEFAAAKLDHRNWVVDFGGLKDFKEALQTVFDHKTVVARDDPKMPWFEEGERIGALDLVILDAVGCESFAREIMALAQFWLSKHFIDHVTVAKVEVCEHGGNSAMALA